MPATRANDSYWINICQVDQKKLANFEKLVHRADTFDRHARKKQKVSDDIDIFLANEKARYNTEIGTSSHPPPMADEWKKLDYWDSGEAILLFNPLPGKSVKQCLCDRGRLLEDIVTDARRSRQQ
jgi:hypothetical protein